MRLSWAIMLFNAMRRRKYAIINNSIEIKMIIGNTDDSPTNAVPTTKTSIGMILYAKMTMKYFIPFTNIANMSPNPGRSSFLLIENFIISY